MLRLSLNSRGNVWYHCTAVLSTHVHSWRIASTGGEWKLLAFFLFLYIYIFYLFIKFQKKKYIKYITFWESFDVFIFLPYVGVLCLLVNARRCLKRPEQRTKNQSPVLAFHQYPTSLWEHRSGRRCLDYIKHSLQ